MLRLVELLHLRGFKPNPQRTKLVRHTDAQAGNAVRSGMLEIYQAFQSKEVFKGCDHIIAFVGEEAVRSRLVGVYRVGERTSGKTIQLPLDCPEDWRAEHHYSLQKIQGLDDLERRVVIDWGTGTLAWHQWLKDKEVVEVTPKGIVIQSFRDYLTFTLTHGELLDLKSAADNREWCIRLQAIGGVYLILATTTGQQYVGSATGTGGVWQRWMDYADTGHGGNRALRELTEADPAYPNAFQYSLLHVFPKTLTRAEALILERQCKNKLDTRVHGLNLN